MREIFIKENQNVDSTIRTTINLTLGDSSNVPFQRTTERFILFGQKAEFLLSEL